MILLDKITDFIFRKYSNSLAPIVVEILVEIETESGNKVAKKA
jgi:hypothetical protein